MGRVGKFGKSLVNKAKSAYGKVTGKRSLNQYKVSPVQDVHGIDNDVINRNHQMRAKASARSGLSKAGKTTGGALRNLPQKALGAARGVRHHIKKSGQYVGNLKGRLDGKRSYYADSSTGVQSVGSWTKERGSADAEFAKTASGTHSATSSNPTRTQRALGAARGVRDKLKKTGQFVGGMGSRKNVSTDNNTGVAYGKRTGSLSKPQKPPRKSRVKYTEQLIGSGRRQDML